MSDIDDDCHPAQALPIGTHTAGEKPQDGLQYLSLVHSEASYIPDVMAVDRSMFDLTSDVTEPRDQSDRLSFPPALINKQVHKFSKLRQYCSRMQKLHPSKLQGEELELTISKKTFDEQPCLSLVLSLSQVSVFELLDYIQEICLSSEEKSRIPTSVSSWIFSLMCVIDKPVPMDYMAIIRAVGRRCAVLSSDLFTSLDPKDLNASSDEPHFQYLVLFILVCHYFQQLDLLEEFGLSSSS